MEHNPDTPANDNEDASPLPDLTADALNKLTVTELRKRSRKLGLSKIWVNKDQLITMILETQVQQTMGPNARQLPPLPRDTSPSPLPTVPAITPPMSEAHDTSPAPPPATPPPVPESSDASHAPLPAVPVSPPPAAETLDTSLASLPTEPGIPPPALETQDTNPAPPPTVPATPTTPVSRATSPASQLIVPAAPPMPETQNTSPATSPAVPATPLMPVTRDISPTTALAVPAAPPVPVAWDAGPAAPLTVPSTPLVPETQHTDPAAAPVVPATLPVPVAQDTGPTAPPAVSAVPPVPVTRDASFAASPTVPATPPVPVTQDTSLLTLISPQFPHDSCSQLRVTLENLTKDIVTIKSKLQTKDNEIELLNGEVKTAYTVIGLLQERISELEQQNRRTNEQQDTSITVEATPAHNDLESGVHRDARLHGATFNANTTAVPEEKKSLLLGDSNLQLVRTSDLENCSIRTIKEADVDLLRCWVSEKLNWSPTTCYIYAGLYDLKNNMDPVSILDNIAALVGELKEKNNRMKIFISQLAPTIISEEFQARIGDLNELLVKWGESNEISIIKTDLAFRFGTGEVDDLCYGLGRESSGCVLNRYGVVRLLNTFSRQCPSFKLSTKWDSIKKSLGVSHTSNNRNDKRNDNVSPGAYKPRTASNYYHGRDYKVLRHSNSMTGRADKGLGAPRYSSATPSSTARESYSEVTRGSYTSSRGHFSHDSANNSRHMRMQRGCYNCGEFNHRQAQCRFDHKLRCQSCKQFGHKSRLCDRYNTY